MAPTVSAITGLLRAGRHVLAHTSPSDPTGAATALRPGSGSARLARATGELLCRLLAEVPLCRAHSDSAPLDGLELMFKGGQMGPPDIFERLLDSA